MDIKDLLVFVQVYENKSMNKAAQVLFMSTQSVSKIIKKLETEFGAVLFERTTSGVIPTYEASLLLPKVTYLIDDFNYLKNMVNSNQHFRFVTTGGIFSYLTPKFLSDFQQFQPNLQLELLEIQDLMIDEILWNEGMELGLRSGPINFLKYDATFFSRHRFCVVLSKHHPLSKLDFIHYTDLKNEPLIVAKGFNFYHAFFDVGVVPNVIYETSELSFLNRFAAEYNIVVISIDFFAFQQQTDGVVIKPFADESCTWDTYLVSKKNKPLSKNAMLFKTFALDWLQDHTRELFTWNVQYPNE